MYQCVRAIRLMTAHFVCIVTTSRMIYLMRKRRINMSTEDMIFELRRLYEKHKNDPVYTGETNWAMLCRDVADRLEELNCRA